MSTDELSCVHEPDLPVALLRVAGALTYATVPDLRRAAQKAITDQPDLLLIDVAGVCALDDITLTAFPMLARQGAEAGTEVMLIGPSPVLSEQLERLGVARQVPVFGTAAQAVAERARRPGPLRMEATLPPDPDSTAAARDLVDRACAQWRVPHLADTAALIVTEFVANALQYAGTPMRVSVALRRRHLHIAVRDGSLRPVRRSGGDDDEPGRGLLIVEGVSAAWGSMQTVGGKVVWAALRLPPGR
ncbi:STAS domain-containing protein [Dactylosporangium salmoneum]|uniref:STAS domain-containing protein n=1 Tax=Dactylosporangium salmoneum TaxID=53361 RepID=A0ABN3FC76_9ACTN